MTQLRYLPILLLAITLGFVGWFDWNAARWPPPLPLSVEVGAWPSGWAMKRLHGCPGFNWDADDPWIEGLGESSDGRRVAYAVGESHDALDWAFVVDATLGCEAINLNSGQWWKWCFDCSVDTPPNGVIPRQSARKDDPE